MSKSSLKEAIAIAGGPTALAKKLGVTRQNVANWCRRGVPAERCIEVEAAVDGQVSRHELRPDVFGPAPGAAIVTRAVGAKPARRSAAAPGGDAAATAGIPTQPMSEAA